MALSLTPDLLGKLFGAAVAAAVGAGAALAGARATDAVVLTRLGNIENDVRFLKCVAGYPGDATAVVRCAALGQAKAAP